jgi:hypothetical protein
MKVVIQKDGEEMDKETSFLLMDMIADVVLDQGSKEDSTYTLGNENGGILVTKQGGTVISIEPMKEVS